MLSRALTWTCLAIVGALLVAATVYDGVTLHLTAESIPAGSWLGVDAVGRDLAARFGLCLWQSVLPLWCVVSIGVALGIVAGAAAGLGIFSRSMWFVASLILGVPVGIWAFILAVAMENAGYQSLLLTFFIFFACQSYQKVRLLHARDGQLAYWQASVVLGTSPWQRLWHHGIIRVWREEILANWVQALRATLAIEVAMSYLGFGVQEPQSSFGNILAAHFDRAAVGDMHVAILATAALLAVSQAPLVFLSHKDSTYDAPHRHLKTAGKSA